MKLRRMVCEEKKAKRNAKNNKDYGVALYRKKNFL